MRLIYWLPIFAIISCQQSKNNTLIISNGTRAEGKISADSVFDGVIKFYDVSTNKLVEEIEFDRGIQSGRDIVYSKQGEVVAKSFYRDGKQNGYSYIYNDNGRLVAQYYFYYGIRMGNNVQYVDGDVRQYWFYSLDDGILFYLDYDSIKGRRLPDIQSSFFFYHVKHFNTIDKPDSVARNTQYFLYTPNPPKFDFKYDLILVDSTRKVLSVLKQFSNSQPWSVFDLDNKSEDSNKKRALRLQIFDSINNVKMGTMRVLD